MSNHLAGLADMITTYNREMESLQRQLEQRRALFIDALIAALEEADPGRAAHCRRVSQYALETSRAMGVDDAQQRTIALAGLLHDFGTLNAPQAIFQKQYALTADERAVLRQCVYDGAQTLGQLHGFDDVVGIISSYYEWFSGDEGFPGKLKGVQIPLGARIIAIANAYDALINRRPGHTPIASQDALMEISARTGTQFDPDVVEAFLTVL